MDAWRLGHFYRRSILRSPCGGGRPLLPAGSASPSTPCRSITQSCATRRSSRRPDRCARGLRGKAWVARLGGTKGHSCPLRRCGFLGLGDRRRARVRLRGLEMKDDGKDYEEHARHHIHASIAGYIRYPAEERGAHSHARVEKRHVKS